MTSSPYVFGLPNESAGYGYINIPKAACSSIKTAIAGHLGASVEECMLAAAPHTHRLPYIRKHKELFWFSVVRHPCDRLVSLWTDFLTPPYPWGILKLNQDLARMAGWPFGEFVAATMRSDPDAVNFHVSRQKELLCVDGWWLADEVYRFENLANVWKELQGCFGLPDLPHCRQTEHPPWQDMFTPELAKLVAQWYWEDFEAFGYEVDVCECA